jgi:hypothetical protein
MRRWLALILVCSSLIVQIGMGALPSGDERVCITIASEASSCCCDDEGDGGATVERCCCCHHGCERCICVPTHDGRATLTARPQTNLGREWLAGAMVFGAPAPLPAYAPPAICAAPRATESPPHLGRLRTTRLII